PPRLPPPAPRPRHPETREALAQRRHHALRAPAERREAVAAAARTGARQGAHAPAEPALERGAHPREAEPPPAVGAAPARAALVATERRGVVRDDQRHAPAPPRGVLERASEGQRERMIAEDALGVRREEFGGRG